MFCKIKECFAHYVKFIFVNDHRFSTTKYFTRMVENFQFQELDDIGYIWEFRSGRWQLKMWHSVFWDTDIQKFQLILLPTPMT
jgi:hypothetical protein